MKKNKRNSGFTLVEVIVAAVILSIAILAMITVTRKSRETDIAFMHQRRVQAIIDSCFENINYQYANYSALPTVSNVPVLIDARSVGASDDLNGSLNIAVNTSYASIGLATVPYKVVEATVTWTEPGEGLQTITIDKWVAQVQ